MLAVVVRFAVFKEGGALVVFAVLKGDVVGCAIEAGSDDGWRDAIRGEGDCFGVAGAESDDVDGTRDSGMAAAFGATFEAELWSAGGEVGTAKCVGSVEACAVGHVGGALSSTVELGVEAPDDDNCGLRAGGG